MVIFPYIIIAVVVGGAIILKWWYSSPIYKGKEGESRVHNILMQLPDDYVILDDRMFMGMHEKPLSDHFIKTMANCGEETSGLSEKLADIAIDILNGDKVGTFIDPDEAAYWHKPDPIDEDTKLFFKRW